MIQETIQTRMRAAIKARDEDGKKLYRFIKGVLDNQPTQPVPDDAAIKIMRSFLKEARANPGMTTFSAREIELLTDLVPATLDIDACRKFLNESGVANQIKGCPKEGMAMGLAMKAFGAGGRVVDSAIVKQLVAELRA